MKRIDWNLIVLAAARDEGLSPVQLQKALFLLGQTVPLIDKGDFYTFKAYNYGPFSKEIYPDAEKLALGGYVTIYRRESQSWSDYKITESGINKAKDLRIKLDGSITKYIDNLVRWVQSLSFRQLLAHVYSQYPKYAKNSMFKVQQ